MSTTLTTTPGAPYAWADSGFTWDGAEAGKAWDDLAPALYTADSGEDMAVAIVAARLPTSSRSDTFGLSEVRWATASAVAAESMTLGETYVDFIAFVAGILESFGLAEAAPRTMTPATHEEVAAFLDGLGKSAIVALLRQVVFAENRSYATDHQSPESIGLAPLSARTPVLAATDGFGFADTDRRGVAGVHVDGLGFAETYSDLIAFIHAITETLIVADRGVHDALHPVAEALALRDRLLRAANAVIADIALRATPLDEDGFRALVSEGHPLGFGAFRDLAPGDYEYANAIVRLILEAPITTTDRIALSAARLNVDVPDVRDRGTAAVPAGGMTVPFNRVFHAPPEIQATFKGGAVLAVPQIGAITETGFFVALIDPNTGGMVAGNLSWSAEGY